MINNLTITNLHLDILKEIGNIGAGNAATALSTLLRKKVRYEYPRCKNGFIR